MRGQPEHLRVRLFGGFAVGAADRMLIDATWNRSRAKAVVKLLALQPQRRLHREQVIDALWPAVDPASAQNQLHKNLHYLRQRLNGDAAAAPIVRLVGPLVELDPAVSVDIAEFRSLAVAGLKTGGTELLEQALALYAGDVLPEDLYEPWTDSHREDLRALRQRVAMELARRYLTQERAFDAADLLRGVLAFEPAYEEAHRELMRAYAAAGERERALRQYDACAAALGSLDVQPDDQTVALRDDLARNPGHQPAVRHPVQELATALQYVSTKDGVQIAYWRVGTGTPLIHLPMGGLSHAARECDLPLMRMWYDGLARHHSLIRYDMRGFGSSDRDPFRITPESALLDLEAAGAVTGDEPVVLFATLDQGRTAVSYAARHPGVVARLILWSSLPPRHGGEFGRDLEVKFGDLKYRDWAAFVNAWAQSIWGWSRAGDARIWARVMRDGASAASLDAFRASEAHRDVTDELLRVEAPTLIVCHRTFPGSQDAASAFAAGIPQAQVLTLDGTYAPWADESNVAVALRVVNDFCAGVADATYEPAAFLATATGQN